MIQFINKKTSSQQSHEVHSINIVFDGDSLTDLNIYPPMLVAQLRNAGYSVGYSKLGVSGRTSIAMLSNVANVLASHNTLVDFNLLIYWIGTNDAYTNKNLSNIDSNLKTYYNTVKSKFKVLQIGTTDLLNDDNFSQQINDMYVANWLGNYSDSFLNLLADSRYQNCLDTSIFYDGVHHTTLGFQGDADLAYPKAIELITN